MFRFALLLALLPGLALAHEGVGVSDAWAPPSLSQPNGVGFLTLNAAGADKFIAVESDCCEAVELHTHVMDGDVMRMRRVDNIPLPDHEDVTLKPGGYHLMLIGLKKPLVDGAAVPLTLKFEKHEPVKTELTVSRAKLSESLQQPRHQGHH